MQNVTVARNLAVTAAATELVARFRDYIAQFDAADQLVADRAAQAQQQYANEVNQHA